MLSLYLPGDSLLHRMPAWAKLLALCIGGTLAVFVSSPTILAIALACVVVLYALARVPVRTAWRMTRSLLAFVVLVVALQWAFTGPTMAALVGLRILLLVLGANLLTLTTSTTELIDTIERALGPLRRFGVRPERVGLAISLTLRFIPVISEQAARVREAQAARGVRAPLTFLVPLAIKTIRMADGVGEALEVRGVDAEEPVRYDHPGSPLNSVQRFPDSQETPYA